eukprot:c5143_g2_i2.p1 GENE.c5143_g2_i2~~c5143_g2_i2.p1  ORF type:complete len:714 (-),score=184.84 c5143_g2_i2:73-2214(-)
MSDNDSRGDDSQDEGDFEDRQEDEELEEVAQNKSTHQKRGKPDSSKKGKPAPKKKRRTQKGVKKFIDTHAEVASSSESEEEPTALQPSLSRDGFQLNLNSEMQNLLTDLKYIHVFRGPNVAESLWFRAEKLNAGSAYAFKVRAVDHNNPGEWSDAAFVALSADVPLPAPAPTLVSAFPHNITLSIVPGHNQGAPILETRVEMAIVSNAALGQWSTPRLLAVLSGPASDDGTFQLTIDELPVGTPFGFRVASTNAIGQGEFGPLAHFSTLQSALAQPYPPKTLSTTSHQVVLKLSMPPIPTRPNRHTIVETNSTLPVMEPLDGDLFHFIVSGTEFLYNSHQNLGSSPLATQMRFHVVANIADDRSFVTVCNASGSTCTIEGLRAHTSFVTKVRSIAPWGTSAWSETAPVSTSNEFPDAPAEPDVIVSHQTGEVTIKWTPSENNGFPISGFQILAGAVPVELVHYSQNLVSTFLPPQKYTISPTSALQKYFAAAPVTRPTLETLKSQQVVDTSQPNASEVTLIPNMLSPEALATLKALPPPATEDDRKDFVDDEDFFGRLLTVVATNVTKLSYVWKPDSGNSSLFVVRVQAENRRGIGPPSPIVRFFTSRTTEPFPPNQPKPPTIARSRPNSLELEWDAPNGNGAVVDSYLLRMFVGELSNNSTQSFMDVYVGSAPSRELTGLVPNQIYYFYLMAFNAVGVSPPSNLVRATTPAA